MLVFSRAIGQSFSIDETFLVLLAAVAQNDATLIRTNTAGTEGVELTIRAGEFQEIAPGVAATFIPFRAGSARIGFEAPPHVRIRRVDGSPITATKADSRRTGSI